MVIKTSSVSWEKRPGDENSSSSSSCSVDVSGKGMVPAGMPGPSRKRSSAMISGGGVLPGHASSAGHDIAGPGGSRSHRTKVSASSSSSKLAEAKGSIGSGLAEDDERGYRDDEDEEDVALSCCDFTMSQAQQIYQRDANRHDLTDNEIMFYKDATPKAEHYMAFRIELPASVISALGSNAEIPIEVELVAIVPQNNQSQSAPPVEFKDRYEAVPDHQSYLKPCPVRTPGPSQPSMERPVVGVTLAYRVELGSYRQGDRRFAILAKLSPKALHEWPFLGSVMPCLTPAVYVASKVKRHRQNAANNSSNIDDYKVDGDHRGGGGGAKGGRHDEQLRSPGSHGFAQDIVSEFIEPIFGTIHERCDHLERIIRLNLIPAIAAIDRKLSMPFRLVEESDEGGAAENGGGALNDEAPSTEPRATWTDMIDGMGNGIQDAMEAEEKSRSEEPAEVGDCDENLEQVDIVIAEKANTGAAPIPEVTSEIAVALPQLPTPPPRDMT